jgi:hypothetical protein
MGTTQFSLVLSQFHAPLDENQDKERMESTSLNLWLAITTRSSHPIISSISISSLLYPLISKSLLHPKPKESQAPILVNHGLHRSLHHSKSFQGILLIFNLSFNPFRKY